MESSSNYVEHTPLGKTTEYVDQYDPNLLCPIPRAQTRVNANLPEKYQGFGHDVWHAYEISWLDKKGKPQVAIGRFVFDCQSPNIIESKSMKLYLNSLNQTNYSSWEEVASTIESDFTSASQSPVKVELFTVDEFENIRQANSAKGTCIDDLDVEFIDYLPSEDILTDLISGSNSKVVNETLITHLFRSNCPVTGQPDWASLVIHYKGLSLNREILLQYLVSYRRHSGFHEQCVEKIKHDLVRAAKGCEITVSASYTRRGGIDICPTRSTTNVEGLAVLFSRQ